MMFYFYSQHKQFWQTEKHWYEGCTESKSTLNMLPEVITHHCEYPQSFQTIQET